MKYFTVSRVDYEDYEPHTFVGADDCTKAQFKSICDSLLEKAGILAIERARDGEYLNFVGWGEVIQSLAILLKGEGFTKVEAEEIAYPGCSIISRSEDLVPLLGDAGQVILDHNKKVMDHIDDY